MSVCNPNLYCFNTRANFCTLLRVISYCVDYIIRLSLRDNCTARTRCRRHKVCYCLEGKFFVCVTHNKLNVPSYQSPTKELGVITVYQPPAGVCQCQYCKSREHVANIDVLGPLTQPAHSFTYVTGRVIRHQKACHQNDGIREFIFMKSSVQFIIKTLLLFSSISQRCWQSKSTEASGSAVYLSMVHRNKSSNR